MRRANRFYARKEDLGDGSTRFEIVDYVTQEVHNADTVKGAFLPDHLKDLMDRLNRKNRQGLMG